MRTLTLVLTGLIFSLPALAGTESISRLAKFLESPVARFAIEETSEGARILERIRGRSGTRVGGTADLIRALQADRGAMEELAGSLESRLSRIEQRLRELHVRGTDEAFTQTLLRRIVREELTIASGGFRDRVFGTQNIEFASPRPQVGFAEAEEIFLNAAGREVPLPQDIFNNFALSLDNLRLGIKAFQIKNPAQDLWVAEAVSTFSEATNYLRQAVPIKVWELELDGSLRHAPPRSPRTALLKESNSLITCYQDLERLLARLEGSPVMTDSLKRSFAESRNALQAIADQISAMPRAPRFRN